jgi:hypothetical protein
MRGCDQGVWKVDRIRATWWVLMVLYQLSKRHVVLVGRMGREYVCIIHIMQVTYPFPHIPPKTKCLSNNWPCIIKINHVSPFLPSKTTPWSQSHITLFHTCAKKKPPPPPPPLKMSAKTTCLLDNWCKVIKIHHVALILSTFHTPWSWSHSYFLISFFFERKRGEKKEVKEYDERLWPGGMKSG